eukprot:403368034
MGTQLNQPNDVANQQLGNGNSQNNPASLNGASNGLHHQNQNHQQQVQQIIAQPHQQRPPVELQPPTIAELPKSTIKVQRISKAQMQLRDADVFKERSVIGQGTFGQVYKAKCQNTGETYALKRIKMDQEKEGFPITAMREIKILKRLNHPNIVKLNEVVTSKPSRENKHRGSVYLVFEFVEHDFHGITDRNIRFELSHLKCIMLQMLEGVAFMHDNCILHRDIKGGNILLNKEGVLKIADFGLARIFYPGNREAQYTTRVVTLWYRAPELLLGQRNYTAAIDMWSVGCFFAELMTGKPLLPGRDEGQQIQLIIDKCGAINDKVWEGVQNLHLYHQLLGPLRTSNQGSKLRQYFRDHQLGGEPQFLDMIEKLLSLDPSKRMTARQALKHPFFQQLPLPCKPSELPKIEGEAHEMIVSQEKKKQQQMKQQQHQSHQFNQNANQSNQYGDRQHNYNYQQPSHNKNEFYQGKNRGGQQFQQNTIDQIPNNRDQDQQNHQPNQNTVNSPIYEDKAQLIQRQGSMLGKRQQRDDENGITNSTDQNQQQQLQKHQQEQGDSIKRPNYNQN